MTLCVLYCYAPNGDFELIIAPDPKQSLQIRSEASPSERPSSSPATLAKHEPPITLTWSEQQFIMQPGNDHEANRSVWMQASSSWMPEPGNEHGDSATTRVDMMDTDGTLHAIINESVHSVDVPLQNPNFQDHEMFSWLHFPMDDSLDKVLCSDLFGNLPSSSVQIVKHSFNQLDLQQEAPFNTSGSMLSAILPSNPSFSGLNVCPTISQGTVEAVESCGSGPDDVRNMVAGADAAMTVDGGQAVGLTTLYSGVEVFSRMQATMQPPLSTGKNSQPVVKPKSSDMVPFLSYNSIVDSSQLYGSSPLPTLKPVEVTFSTPQTPLQRNFSLFSCPAAETKANLHVVGAGSGPTNVKRARQQYGQLGKAELNAIKQPSHRDSVATQNDNIHGRWALPQSPLPPPASFSGHVGETSKGKSIGEDNLVNSNASNSAITASNKAMEKLHIADQTATSPSRASDSSSEKSGKETATMPKRKFSGGDDSEYQSEDVEEATNSSKKLVKRTRAAEMHNLCERKRRDRINEKLMALRELMPNSSKTAKASILDEAIEYVKLLQSQLQAWSTRTGICIPPALMPNMGMQHVQMPALPHMGLGMGVGMGVGLGMGMGMGMGMGLMDVNAAAVAGGHTMVAMPPFPPQPSAGPSHAMSGLQPGIPSLSMANSQDHLQSPHMLDPYNLYVPHHQVQPASMNLNMYRNLELYNAYMQGQRQQQHHHQQQQWQLQQQQLQQLQRNNGSKPTQ